MNNGKATSEQSTLPRESDSGSACNDLLCGLYRVIYADPPWKYNDTRGDDPRWGAMTYPTMATPEIAKMPVGRLAAPDATLFLWATMPLLPDAFDVMAGWGFRYVTCAFVWVKQYARSNGAFLFVQDVEATLDAYSGLGSWTNSNAELCLLGKRGKPKRVANDVKQIVVEPRRKHSQKPREVRRRIERLMGDCPRVELFAREKAIGWDIWGNELPNDVELTT